MTIADKPSRSAYATTLRTFDDCARVDDDAFRHRGKWSEVFRKRVGARFNGRIVFEIGCFDAAYLAAIAHDNPETGFVGLDWKCKPLCKGAKGIVDRGLRNVMLLRTRAQDIARIFAAREVDEIWVFHPDLFGREEKFQHPLIAPAFLADAQEALRDEWSVLAMKTDQPGYYQWMLAMFGMAEPEWFHTSVADSPRVRLRDLMREEDLPPVSEDLRRRFEVGMNAADFWNDSAALAHTAGRLFSQRVTLFESRFVKRRFPIYYFELRKKRE